jgi:hypothetical protein
MKLDLIPDGDDGRPLVRIWGFAPAEARLLHEAVTGLAGGQAESVEVHSLPGVEPVDSCRLTLKVGEEDRGVYDLIGENSFECLLRRHKWEQVADLIRPFCEEAGPRGYYQWLDDAGDISLLLSEDGEW